MPPQLYGKGRRTLRKKDRYFDENYYAGKRNKPSILLNRAI